MAVTVTTTPATAGTLSIETYEVLTGFSVAAGKYMVHIKNVGSLIPGGLDVDIDVNGYTLSPGEEILMEAEFDAANNTYLTTPAITVTNASGAGVWYRVKGS
ncbi:MAG: hypothetical protein D6706_05280 [Chloroflexi bacterium]|nr:MAG: hypothetical protein D6706_05280 [Chloroflexota bacterium]